MSTSPAQRFCQVVAPIAALILCLATAAPASAADQVYFSAVEDVGARLVERIYAETTRIDMSAWYLTDYRVKDALLNRHRAGIPVRLIGDRGSIFEIDDHTKNTFYELASQGVPIRLRYNPTWYPEIDHWKATIFVDQGIVAFGSPNYTPFELTPDSPSNYKDEVVLFTDETALVNAFKTKFDRYWNDTLSEPESLIPTAPYFRNWDDACMNESECWDYRVLYPNAPRPNINTARLENDYPLPSSMVWGQGPSFNNRLVTEIEAEQTAIDFVIYRLTVDNITQALLTKHQSLPNLPIRLIIEPDEYGNRKWPEFWITHANIDKLWAAGINIKQRAHAGLTHMKVLITSNIATIASSNFAAAWQRDHNYFLPRTAKPTIHTAIKNRFQAMWNDQVGFVDFTPDPPDQPTPTIPAPGATNVPTTTTLTWDRAVFATSYDVYLGTSPGSMELVGQRAGAARERSAAYVFVRAAVAARAEHDLLLASRLEDQCHAARSVDDRVQLEPVVHDREQRASRGADPESLADAGHRCGRSGRQRDVRDRDVHRARRRRRHLGECGRTPLCLSGRERRLRDRRACHCRAEHEPVREGRRDAAAGPDGRFRPRRAGRACGRVGRVHDALGQRWQHHVPCQVYRSQRRHG